MIFFTSDMHYGHEKVIKYSKRPFKNCEEMKNEFVARWNKRVKKDNLVYVLGDFSFENYENSKNILSELLGKKILIKGNHDRFSYNQYKSMGFESVFEEVAVKLLGNRIKLSHYPARANIFKRIWSYFFYPKYNRYLERRPILKNCDYLLHGHTHSKIKKQGRMIHVGVDSWNFYPVSLSEIGSLISSRIKISTP